MSAGAATPRRILYVVNEDFAFLLNRLPMARAARDAGFEVHVATNVNKGAAAIEAEGFVLHRIPFRRGGLSPLAALPTILAIRKIERQIRPSIVHHSGLQCCVFGSLAALGQGFPVVNAITGLGYVFTSARLLKQGMAWLLPLLLNRSHSSVLVQNPDDRQALLALGVRPGRITLIPGSGVDDQRLQPLPEPEGAITIGFAGRLLVDKGIRALVAAHTLLRDQGHDFNLLIAGNPDPANPASVSREEVEEWTRRPGITWLGHLDDIVSLWRASHIAALPSHREGLPGSLMEAAACGRPLVATDVPGCREIAIAGQTGLLVPVEDPPALAEAILRLAQSGELRARYGAAARKLVEDKLSARIIGKSTVALYDKLTRDPRSPEASPTGPAPGAGKIVMVSQYYLPFPSTTSRYMTEIAEELAKGSEVLVLSGAPGSASLSSTVPGRPEIIEIKSWWPGKGALVSRSIADALFSLHALLAVVRHARAEDVVLTVTAPFALPYAVALAARLRKSASVLILHDLYPESLVMAGLVRAGSLVARAFRALNRLIFARLDAIIIIGRDMAPKLLAYPKVGPAKLSLIPNWASIAAGYREIDEDNPFRRRCGGGFIVAMSGNAGYTHDPLSVLEAARLLQDRREIKFLLSGHGVGWSKIKEQQAASPCPNVTLIERVADSELEDFLAAGDVWVVPYRKDNAGVSVPSRIYNTFAVGRPIIVCSDPDAEAALLSQQEAIGWVMPPEDPKALADAIVLAASNPAETEEKGRRAAEVAGRYTAKICLGAYRDLMEKLLLRQRARGRQGLEQVALPPPGS